MKVQSLVIFLYRFVSLTLEQEPEVCITLNGQCNSINKCCDGLSCVPIKFGFSQCEDSNKKQNINFFKPYKVSINYKMAMKRSMNGKQKNVNIMWSKKTIVRYFNNRDNMEELMTGITDNEIYKKKLGILLKSGSKKNENAKTNVKDAQTPSGKLFLWNAENILSDHTRIKRGKSDISSYEYRDYVDSESSYQDSESSETKEDSEFLTLSETYDDESKKEEERRKANRTRINDHASRKRKQ